MPKRRAVTFCPEFLVVFVDQWAKARESTSCMGVWSPQQQTFPEGPGCWPRLSMSDIRKTGALHDLWAATRLEGSLHVRHHIGGAQPGRSHASSMVDRWGGGLHHPGTFSREAEPFTSPGWVSSSRYEAV